jgi:hypothetical protein
MFTKTIPGRSALEVLNPTKKTKKKKTPKTIKKIAPAVKKTASKKRTTRVDSKIENADKTSTRSGARLPRVANQVHSVNNSGTDSQSNSNIPTPPPAPAATPEERLRNYRFEIGTKYMMDCDTPSPCIYTVKNAYKDSTMEFRKVWSLENGLEVIDLSRLMQDKYEPGFMLIGNE